MVVIYDADNQPERAALIKLVEKAVERKIMQVQ